MAIQTQVISGTLSSSDGTFLSDYSVRFRLSGYDATNNGVISSVKDYVLPIEADGSIAGDIWPNEAGVGGTFYHVHIIDERSREVEYLGRLQIGNDGPYLLEDLVREQSPTQNPGYIRVISAAEYQLILEAAESAGSASEAAASAASALAHKNDAEGARDLADGHADRAETARDQAQGHASTAAAEAATATANSSGLNLGGITDYELPITPLGAAPIQTLGFEPWRFRKSASWYKEDRTTGNYLGTAANATAAWGLTDAASGDYVYDTTGNAFRELTTSNAWAATTRAGSAYFPAKTLVTYEANRVIIWDISGQEPTMWATLSINTATQQGCFIQNGVVGIFSDIVGIVAWDFSAERLNRWITSGKQSQSWSRVDGTGPDFSTIDASAGIINNTVNDVAITYLPDAPCDEWGNRVPTIAVGTDGGVSVIKHDGTVVDITSSTFTMRVLNVAFDGNDIVFTADAGVTTIQRIVYVVAIPDIDVAWVGNDFLNHNGPDERYIQKVGGAWAGDIRLPISAGTTAKIRAEGGNVVLSNSAGLANIIRDMDSPEKGLFFANTTEYHTGLMVGDIKGCFLTGQGDDTDLVGAAVFDVDFSTYADQAEAEAEGWEFGTGWALTGGQAVFTAGSAGKLRKAVTTPIGNFYVAQVDGSKGAGAFVSLNLSDQGLIAPGIGNGAQAHTVQSEGTSQFFEVSAGAGGDYTLDTASLKLADPDRSVNGKGLIINGTITKTQETDSDFMWYSGWSSSTNYMLQPYNSDLDFGTGDFCVMGWVKDTATNNDFYLDRMDTARSGAEFALATVGSDYRFIVDVSLDSTSGKRSDGMPHQVIALRKNGLAQIWVDGVLEASAASTSDLDNASATLTIGVASSLASDASDASLALFRITATAPTPEQIAEIYRIEDAMRQGEFLLGGSSDAVLDISYDWSTRELHVLTSSGVSTFDMDTWQRTSFVAGSHTALAAGNGALLKI